MHAEVLTRLSCGRGQDEDTCKPSFWGSSSGAERVHHFRRLQCLICTSSQSGLARSNTFTWLTLALDDKGSARSPHPRSQRLASPVAVAGAPHSKFWAPVLNRAGTNALWGIHGATLFLGSAAFRGVSRRVGVSAYLLFGKSNVVSTPLRFQPTCTPINSNSSLVNMYHLPCCNTDVSSTCIVLYMCMFF